MDATQSRRKVRLCEPALARRWLRVTHLLIGDGSERVRLAANGRSATADHARSRHPLQVEGSLCITVPRSQGHAALNELPGAISLNECRLVSRSSSLKSLHRSVIDLVQVSQLPLFL